MAYKKCTILNLILHALINTSISEDDTKCPVPAPCICDLTYNMINCRQRNLTSVPTVSTSSEVWSLDLGGNRIQNLSSGSFHGLKLRILSLDDNVINSVADDAFSGSEDSLVSVQLQNNLLTKIPLAFGNLQKIAGIMLQRNPISDLDDAVLSNISSTMNEISLGSGAMESWPKSMALLVNLSVIELYDLPFSELPDDVFHTYRNKLMSLNVYNTRLIKLPSSMNELDHLANMVFQNNQYLSANAFSESVQTLSSLQHVQFQNNSFKTLPSIFARSTRLISVTVMSEPLLYLRDNTFLSHTSPYLWYIFINATQLDSVPSTLSALDSVRRLELTYSNVREIQQDDFIGLFNLQVLHLSGNPIVKISDKTFMNTQKLTYVALEYTNLTTIPKAIQNVPTLMVVTLNDSPVQCDCISLGWIKRWTYMPNDLQIYGTCLNNGMKLMDYITKHIPKCPLSM